MTAGENIIRTTNPNTVVKGQLLVKSFRQSLPLKIPIQQFRFLSLNFCRKQARTIKKEILVIINNLMIMSSKKHLLWDSLL